MICDCLLNADPETLRFSIEDAGVRDSQRFLRVAVEPVRPPATAEAI